MAVPLLRYADPPVPDPLLAGCLPAGSSDRVGRRDRPSPRLKIREFRLRKLSLAKVDFDGFRVWELNLRKALLKACIIPHEENGAWQRHYRLKTGSPSSPVDRAVLGVRWLSNWEPAARPSW